MLIERSWSLCDYIKSGYRSYFQSFNIRLCTLHSVSISVPQGCVLGHCLFFFFGFQHQKRNSQIFFGGGFPFIPFQLIYGCICQEQLKWVNYTWLKSLQLGFQRVQSYSQHSAANISALASNKADFKVLCSTYNLVIGLLLHSKCLFLLTFRNVSPCLH